MTDRTDPDLMYVAPEEAHDPRRPPVSELGIIHWMRENLFRNTFDSVVTVVTSIVIVLLLYNLITWAFLEAQWEVVFANMRALGVGLSFPPSEVWRAELAAIIVMALVMFSVGIWGQINRTVTGIVVVLTLMVFFVPRLTVGVPEPPIHFYADATYNIRHVNFIAQEGDEIQFTIDPLTTPEDFELSGIQGYIENDNQAANTSFDAFAEANTEINFSQTRNPSEYDLSLQIQVFNGEGEVINQSQFTEGSTDSLNWSFTAPYSGWYMMTMNRDEENSTAGAAWLIVEGVEVYRSTTPAEQERVEKYGPQPEITCDGCVQAEVIRTAMRFEGQRTFAQWFSLQLAPFLLTISNFYYQVLAASIAAYFLGKLILRVRIETEGVIQTIERGALQIALVFFVGYLGVIFASAVNPREFWGQLRLMVLISFMLAIFVYALVQFIKPSEGAKSRGLSLLWMLSIPIMLALITGLQTPAETAEVAETPLPPIDSSDIGGLLLTLLISAVAIIASFPIGMALALGRQSNLPVVSALSALFIEVIRGVPLITLLFMGRLILPFFGFGLGDVDLLIRISVVMTLFTSAYMAEVIRGGLQVVPDGQIEASKALGLNDFWTTVLIKLPQALRAVIPAMMGQAVSLFKDSSLVFIVGLFEILGTMGQILGDSQTGYTVFPREGYIYLGLVYFVFSYIMADMSRRIERTGSGAIRRDTM